jgi:NAD(P)-dependent dehydrogenase (short-subunit alcohol dehydrogenase family)
VILVTKIYQIAYTFVKSKTQDMNTHIQELKGKIALITGGNSGIGYATAKELNAQGAEVIITGRRKEAVDKAAADLGVTGLVADQGQLRAIEQLASQISEKYGKIDILFINAGVLEITAIADATERAFDNIINVNFKGAYFTLSKFIPLLNEKASVVFLSSNTASMNGADTSIYSSSKAALNAIMKIAAVELAPRKIRVNSVSPGPIETEIMNKVGYSNEQLKNIREWMINKIPLKKIGRAGDVGKMVAHFCGPAADFITGAEIVMDGGMRL